MKTTTSYFRTTMPSPIGELTIVANDDAIVAIDWEGESGHAASIGGADPRDVAPGDHPALTVAVEQLTEYFANGVS
jgi:methylated-DNA-[protein]-cysteine S-methyltransferase